MNNNENNTQREDVINLLNNYDVNRRKIINDKDNTNFINKFVNNIYIINLETDFIKRNYINILMEKYHINYELIIVKRPNENVANIIKKYNNNLSNGEIGCYLSHMYCYYDVIQKNALDASYENIIIFEDDIMMHKDFNKLFEQIIKNKKIDFLMLGASDYSFSDTNYRHIDKKMYIYSIKNKTKYIYGSHGIMYSIETINVVFNERLTNITYVDDNLYMFFEAFKNTSFICYPNLVIPDFSLSNLGHNIYKCKYLYKIYKKKCFLENFDFKIYNFVCLALIRGPILLNSKVNYKETMHRIYKFKKTEFKMEDNILEYLDYDFLCVNDLIKINSEN